MITKLNKAAGFYLEKGWNIVPCNFKKAILKKGKVEKQVSFLPDYGKYHNDRVTAELAEKWWESGKYNSIAIITGKISGITVIDIDTKNLPEMKYLPKTFTVETNRGYHFYFKYFEKAKTSAQKYGDDIFSFNLDIRNDGGIVYAAPGEYELPDGKKAEYKVIDWTEPADFPIEWGKKIYGKYSVDKKKSDWKEKIINPIENGSRNNSFASVIGGLLHRFPQDDWETTAWPMVKSHNSAQKEPLEERELRTVFNSISQAELKKRLTGGEIRDVSSEFTEDEIRIKISLEKSEVCFKAKNISNNLLEGNVVTWIQKGNDLSQEIDFYFKLKSDSNKEQWARILSKAFDKKQSKEIYPWTLLVNKASAEIEKVVRNFKQDFSALDPEAVPKQATWLLEPFIQEDQINTFYGLGSSGKTLLAIYFALLVSEDKEVNVMLVDYENDINSWADKLKKLNCRNKERLIYYDSQQIPLFEQMEKLKEVIKRRNIGLLVIDSASMASGDSTSDEKAALRLVSAIKNLRITTVLIAHQRKNDGERTPIGSIQYENQSRNVWNFARSQDDEDDRIIHVAMKHTKSNNSYLRKNPFGYRISFSDDSISIENENAMENFEDKFSVSDRIKKLLFQEPGLDYKEISKKLNVGVPTVSKNLTRGKNKGLFDNNEKGEWYLAASKD